MKRFIFVAVMFFLVACQSQSLELQAEKSLERALPTVTLQGNKVINPTSIPTLSEPTKTQPTTATTKVTSCSVDIVVEKLKSIIPYDEFTLSYMTINGEQELYFWIVDPKLNPEAKKEELEDNFELAVLDSIELAYNLKKSNDCVSELFKAINPVVVDKNHNGWFSGLIDVEAIPANPDFIQYDEDFTNRRFEADALDVALKSLYSHNLWERKDIAAIQNIPKNSCTWSEVLEKVSRHFYKSPLNSYILVSDNTGVTFTVQYRSKTNDKNDELVVFLNTARELSCLLPPVESVVVIIVDKEGKWLNTRRFPLTQEESPSVE
jgi:hypothetical protein